MPEQRPRALVTAAVRGPGLTLLEELADVTLDSWLEQPTLRIYNADQLAERVAAEGARIVVVESDRCAGALFDQPLLAVCSCRGDPNNVDVLRPPPPAFLSSMPPPVMPTPSPSWPWRCCSRRPEVSSAPMLTSVGAKSTRTARFPTNGSGRGSWPVARQAWSAWAPSGAALRWRLRGLGLEVIAYDPYAPEPTVSLDELLRAPT